MKNFTSRGQLLSYFFTTAMVLLATLSSTAQVVRPYGAPLFSDNLTGGHTLFGNTILQGSNMNSVQTPTRSNGFTTSNFGNDNNNMQWINIDGAPPATIFNFEAGWNYYVRTASSSNMYDYTTSNGPGSYPSTNYNQTTDAWDNDDAPIRFDMGSGGTVLNCCDGRAQNRNTYYFRKSVTITGDPALYTALTINVRYDDGIVVYVNNTEVGRASMPTGSFNYNTDASSCGGTNFRTASFNVPVSLLLTGNNIIAAEVHQGNNCSGTADMYFDMSFTGTVPTFNSSSADLVLPAGASIIKFARLYWGGRIENDEITANDANLKTVKIRKGNGNYQTITGAAIDKTTIASSPAGASAYQGFFDVTTFVKQNGAGTYTVANIATTTGSVGGGGNYGGWSMVVVYENSNRPFSSVRIYDGFIQVEDGTTQTITLTGLNAPSTPALASDIYMSAMAWEGDANIGATTGNPTGDFMEINTVKLSNIINPAQNFWNGTISKNGAHVTSKSPNFINQMGIDIDEVEVGTGFNIDPNSTQVTVRFGTEQDQYFPSVFAFTMIAKPPLVTINKTGTITGPGAAQNLLFPNQTITYTLSGSNNGNGNALLSTITDTIPASITYIPGTLVINSSPGGIAGSKTDAQGDDQAFATIFDSKTYVKYFIGTGATANSGGVLKPGETYSVQFKCLTSPTANSSQSVSNTARITGESVSGEPFVDDATFLFGPALPVNLIAFKVSVENNNAILKWTTAGEANNERFDIERSLDGVNFSTVGSVPGNGTTSATKNYSFTDPLPTNATIVYYRLTDVDMNGKTGHSKIVSVRLNETTTLNSFFIYPNPFTSSVQMQLTSARETTITVRIYNAVGQHQISRTLPLQPGENIVVIKDLDALKSGVYLVEIITEDGKITQKIIKN